MSRNLPLLLILPALWGQTTHAAPLEWVSVGNPGNVDDVTGFGGVDYTYRISKHEVTNAQYVKFLNAVDPNGMNPDLGGGDGFLYNPLMASDARGGILFNSNAADGFKYAAKSSRSNNPVVFVSFYDAMRFTNWLTNGRGPSDTEVGAYTIGGGADEVRSPSAKYWVPSEDEWYKAAYYSPDDGYYNYPTGHDGTPFSDDPFSLSTPDNTNVANVFNDDAVANGYNDGFATTGSTLLVENQNYLTDVGAYPLAASPSGTFDQGGNALEWNESTTSDVFRGLRGGSWLGGVGSMHAVLRTIEIPAFESSIIGFRVAAVPEPSTSLLAVAVVTGMSIWRRRCRKPMA